MTPQNCPQFRPIRKYSVIAKRILKKNRGVVKDVNEIRKKLDRLSVMVLKSLFKNWWDRSTNRSDIDLTTTKFHSVVVSHTKLNNVPLIWDTICQREFNRSRDRRESLLPHSMCSMLHLRHPIFKVILQKFLIVFGLSSVSSVNYRVQRIWESLNVECILGGCIEVERERERFWGWVSQDPFEDIFLCFFYPKR